MHHFSVMMQRNASRTHHYCLLGLAMLLLSFKLVGGSEGYVQVSASLFGLGRQAHWLRTL